MQQAQGGKPSTVPGGKEEGCVIQHKQLHVLGTARFRGQEELAMAVHKHHSHEKDLQWDSNHTV